MTLIGFVGPIVLIAVAVKIVDARDKRRKAEKKIAVVASAVTTKELPERAFSAIGFRVDYAEDATPAPRGTRLPSALARPQG